MHVVDYFPLHFFFAISSQSHCYYCFSVQRLRHIGILPFLFSFRSQIYIQMSKSGISEINQNTNLPVLFLWKNKFWVNIWLMIKSLFLLSSLIICSNPGGPGRTGIFKHMLMCIRVLQSCQLQCQISKEIKLLKIIFLNPYIPWDNWTFEVYLESHFLNFSVMTAICKYTF